MAKLWGHEPTQFTPLRLFRKVPFLKDRTTIVPRPSDLRACDDCSSGKFKKQKVLKKRKCKREQRGDTVQGAGL